MTVTSKSVNMLAVTDALIVAVASMLCFMLTNTTTVCRLVSIAIFIVIVMLTLNLKGFYRTKKFRFKEIYLLFEGLIIASLVAGVITAAVLQIPVLVYMCS